MPDPHHHLEEGRRSQQLGMLERALECYRRAAEEAEEPALASEAWRRMSSIHRSRCRWEDALEAAHRSRSIARRVRDVNGESEALNAEAAVFMSRGEFRVAQPLLEDAVELATSDRTLGISLQNLGYVAARTGELDAAERYLQAAAAHFRQTGYRWGEACVLTSFAAVALDQKRYELARNLSERAETTAREIEDLNLLALAIKNRAEALAGLGELAAAHDLASEALGYFGASGDVFRQVESFKLLGDICSQQGDTVAARACFETGLELARRVEVRLESRELGERLGALAGPPRNAAGGGPAPA